jgi:hypothetical protein
MKKFLLVALMSLMACAVGCGGDDGGGGAGGGGGSDAADVHDEDTTQLPDTGPDAEDSGPSDGGGDTGTDAGDTGADADGGTTQYPDDISFEAYQDAFLSEQISLLCTVGWQCASPMAANAYQAKRFNSEQACRDELPNLAWLQAGKEHQTNRVQRLIDAGRVIFDSDQAATCLNMIANLSEEDTCDTRLVSEIDECLANPTLTGTIGEGGDCIESMECADEHAYCDTQADSCDGTCTINLPDCGGEVCTDSQFCQRPDNGTDSCESLKTEGAQCEDSRECGEGLSCLVLDSETTGVCLSRGSRARGEACTTSFFCQGSDQCIDETCEAFAFVDQGDACDSDVVCEPGTSCRMTSPDSVVGTCQPPADVGETCLYTDDCLYELYCDRPDRDQAGSCARVKSDGASCDRGEECESGTCVSDTCGGQEQLCPVP